MGALTSHCCGDKKESAPVSSSRLLNKKTGKLMNSASIPKLCESTNVSTNVDANFAQDHQSFNIHQDQGHQSLESLPLNYILKFSDFIILGQLGVGSYATVYLVQLKNEVQRGHNIKYAMKRISKDEFIDKKVEQSTKLQKYILSNKNHPFITDLKFSFQDGNYVYLIMEYAVGGSVQSFLAIKKIQNIKKDQRIIKFAELGQQPVRFITAGVILAFQYLHHYQIMYRDLKPQNVIIFEDGYPKLTDFGLAKMIGDANNLSKTQAGTVIYYSPEIVLRQGYTKLADLWTLGVFIYELATSQTPFKQSQILTRSKFKNVVLQAEKQRNWRSQHLSDQIKDIINGFLKFEPKERLGAKGFDEIKSHAFFKTFDWQSFQNKKMHSPLLPIIRQYPFKIKKINKVVDSKIYQSQNSQKSSENEDNQWTYNYYSLSPGKVH